MTTLRHHLHAARLSIHLKTIASYRATLRSNVRALWTGTWDEFEFVDAMFNSITAGLTTAFNEGLASIGATGVNVSPEERRELRNMLDNERAQVDSLTDFIMANSRVNKGNLQACFDRLQLWLNRYPQVFDFGVFAGLNGDDNLKWELGATEEHCPECFALNGIVASKANWEASGLHPKRPPNDRLTCGGWRCDCRRNPTTEPATKGGIPSV